MRRELLVILLIALAEGASAQVGAVRVPAVVVAGSEATISVDGSGKGTFYLLGPGVSRKEDISLGREVRISPQDTQHAGAYLAIACAETCHDATFYVTTGDPASLSFLVHPSRVPVAQDDAISAVAFPFDQFHNLVLKPVTVDFQMSAGKASLLSRRVDTKDGVAWFRTTSGKSAGAVQVVAELNNVSSRRVVQQVASDPCNLRITGQRNGAGILVQTEPVHDCAGNPVPDGTVVTFTATDSQGKSTVDAPIKQGIARAQIPEAGNVVVSVASGVVMGNDLHIGGQP